MFRLLLFFFLLWLGAAGPLSADDFDSQRQRLLREITDLAEETAVETGVEWAIVEMDTSSFEAIALGIANLRKMGLVA